MIWASAPGKFVILGEHAVVYGKPAIALAIDMRFNMRLAPAKTFRVNGRVATERTMSRHMHYISKIHGNDPVSIFINRRIPAGSGLGSSAALSVAYSGAVRAMKNLPYDGESVAREAYEAEYDAQGGGSPMDTSVSANGGGVAFNVPYKKEDFLWHLEKGDNSWDASKFKVPEMMFVIGNTGIRAATGPLVEKVKNCRDSDPFVADIIDEIGDVALDGLKAIKENDPGGLGTLMNHDHKLLSALGVSCPELDKLCEAAGRHSYGAKLTGSGNGGCMVALTDRPEKVAETIAEHGGIPYIVKTGIPGLQIDVTPDGPRRHHKGRRKENGRYDAVL